MCAGAPKSSCAADQGQGVEVPGREQRCGVPPAVARGGGGVRSPSDPMIVPAPDPLSRFKLPQDRPGPIISRLPFVI
jgi:hypothetical protein